MKSFPAKMIVFEQLIFPVFSYISRHDFVVHSGNSCSIIPCLGKEILLVHDVSFTKMKNLVPGGNSWKRILGRLYRKHTLRLGLRRAYKVITVSEFAKSDISSEYAVDPNKIFVVPNGVSLEKNEMSAEAIDQNRDIDICFVSGTDDQKNLFRTLDFIVKNPKLCGLKVVVAGVGIDEVPHSYPKNFLFKGYMDNLELREVYRKSRYFCMPSWYESFAIPALEAYAFGCDLVLSNRGAPLSIFGPRARYFCPDSFDGLVQGFMKKVIDQPRQEREAFVERFAWEKNAQKFDELVT